MENIIYNDNEIIGKIEALEKTFKNEIIEQLKNNIDIEEIQQNFNMMCDVILSIRENEQENINNDCYFKLIYNPMGNYNYKVLKECE